MVNFKFILCFVFLLTSIVLILKFSQRPFILEKSILLKSHVFIDTHLTHLKLPSRNLRAVLRETIFVAGISTISTYQIEPSKNTERSSFKIIKFSR